jgi:uncharacterized membrane protein YjjP (DUF1212 family)
LERRELDPPPLEQAPVPADVRCILVLSAELLGYGLPVHRVEESVTRLARAFGRRCSVLGLPTSLSITFYEQSGGSTHVVRAEPGVVHLGRLDALHRLVGRVERGELGAADTLQAIDGIVLGSSRRRWTRELGCVALVAAGGAQLLSGDLADSLTAGVIAPAVAGLVSLPVRAPKYARIAPVVVAACVTLASAAAAHLGWTAHPLVVSLASMLAFLPGFTLTLSMIELATGHMVCGAARGVAAALTFTQLGFGMLLGVRLGAVTALTPAALAMPPVWLEACGAVALAAGFAGLLNISAADSGATFAVSALAWSLGRVLAPWSGAELAVLVAATAVGLVSNTFAHHRDRPSSLLLVPGMLMLVPGSLGMLSVSSALLHEPARAWSAAVQMLGLMMALCTGVLVASALVPPRSGL